MNCLEAKQLECLRGDNLLFSRLDFTAEAGSILQIKGANGAGKTSLLRILCGLSQPESGQVIWNGVSIHEDRENYGQNIVYIGHKNGIKEELSVEENLKYESMMRPLNSTCSLNSAIKKSGLNRYHHILGKMLSAGQKQRIGLCRLMLLNASIWILDEPAIALDIDARALLSELIQQHVAYNGIVIFTSHQELEIDPLVIKVVDISDYPGVQE